ncbi:MAG TPA: MFS transporter, partial [Candidatus Eisenbacteria bacterium]
MGARAALPQPPPAADVAPRRGIPGIGRNVVALGIISLLTDLSSDMVIPVLPLFVTRTLRGSAASLGVIEGVAECTASLLRVVSGWLSDRSGHRKPFLGFGYGLSTVAKAAMAFARSWPWVLVLRFGDRVGKGLRNPPRDALIADSVEPRYFGRAFGFHRALDTVGATLGPLVAFAMLRAFPGEFRRLFLASAIPAALALVVLALAVRAPARAPLPRPDRLDPAAGPLGPAFGRLLWVAGAFSLASSSLAFPLLYVSRVGFTAAQVPLVYFGYNLVYAVL